MASDTTLPLVALRLRKSHRGRCHTENQRKELQDEIISAVFRCMHNPEGAFLGQELLDALQKVAPDTTPKKP
eukprot:4252221-Prorocentrum_lima.AAC.1